MEYPDKAQAYPIIVNLLNQGFSSFDGNEAARLIDLVPVQTFSLRAAFAGWIRNVITGWIQGPSQLQHRATVQGMTLKKILAGKEDQIKWCRIQHTPGQIKFMSGKESCRLKYNKAARHPLVLELKERIKLGPIPLGRRYRPWKNAAPGSSSF